jgi:hypothetical protein
MEQLLCHLFGDYFFQPDWCALNKSKRTWPCLVHVLLYTACFLFLTFSWKALLVIGATHFIIDRWHTPLKRFIWLRGHLDPKFRYPDYKWCNTTGFYDDSPYNICSGKNPGAEYKTPDWWGKPRHFFITMWLYIIHDNLLHLTINYFALKYLSNI